MTEFAIRAEQAEAVASLARLYMSNKTVTITEAECPTGWVAVRTDKWRWFIGPDGRVTAEGALDGN
jgi:hypothetical protein